MIVSASRRTDIPAFYAPWFLHRLRAREALVPNPYNSQRASRVSLDPQYVDCIVFFSKNPAPLLPYLPEVRALGHRAAFQYTLNAYGAPLEPRLPPLSARVQTFLRLADWSGTPHALTWRYDPVLLHTLHSPGRRGPAQAGAAHSEAWHIDQFGTLCRALQGYVHRCVFSFVDAYPHRADMSRFLVPEQAQRRLAAAFARLADEHHMVLGTCAEAGDFAEFGIGHTACLDAEQLARVTGYPLRVPPESGRRQHCCCVQSYDVGVYNTCPHGCVYCYAVSNAAVLRRQRRGHDPHAPALAGELTPDTIVSERGAPSCRAPLPIQQGRLC